VSESRRHSGATQPSTCRPVSAVRHRSDARRMSPSTASTGSRRLSVQCAPIEPVGVVPCVDRATACRPSHHQRARRSRRHDAGRARQNEAVGSPAERRARGVCQPRRGVTGDGMAAPVRGRSVDPARPVGAGRPAGRGARRPCAATRLIRAVSRSGPTSRAVAVLATEPSPRSGAVTRSTRPPAPPGPRRRRGPAPRRRTWRACPARCRGSRRAPRRSSAGPPQRPSAWRR